jgi:protein-arginine kinase activator protein McsA
MAFTVIILKKCTKCHVDKPSNEYYSHKKTKDRLCPICKECASAKRKLRHQLKKSYENLQNSQYRKVNRAKLNNYRKKNRPHLKNRYLGKVLCPKCGKVGYGKISFDKNLNTGTILYRQTFVQHPESNKTWTYCTVPKDSFGNTEHKGDRR